jgi:hypothetical protein
MSFSQLAESPLSRRSAFSSNTTDALLLKKIMKFTIIHNARQGKLP